jgi:hypothetical protein
MAKKWIFRSTPPITANASPKSTCACPGSCRSGHEHLALPLPALVHVVLYDRDPAGISLLVAQPLEDPLRGMLLLGRLTLIVLQDPPVMRPPRSTAGPSGDTH